MIMLMGLADFRGRLFSSRFNGKRRVIAGRQANKGFNVGGMHR